MSFTLQKRKRFGPVKRFLAASAAVGAIAAGWWVYDDQVRPRYLQHELETASDEQVPAIVRKLCSSGSEGMQCLVAALGSPRAVVATQARQTLRAELDQWELLSSRQASPRLLALAEALAGNVERLDDDGRNAAADMALRILLWPIEEGHVDRPRLVTACDRVLRSKATAIEIEEAAGGRGPQIATLLEQPHLSGPRAMPPGELPLPPLPNEVAVYEGGEEPARVQPIATVADPKSTVVPAMVAAPEGPAQPARAVVEDYSGLDGFELFKRWHRGDAVVRAAIDEELRHRGYKSRQIEIARHLTATDPEERRRWAEALPGLSGFDAKPWLLRLSHDTDPDVRLTAVVLMATSSDPQMLRRVADVARSDPDDRVQEQAARAIQQQ